LKKQRVSAHFRSTDPASRSLNKSRTVPKSADEVGNPRAACSADVLQNDFEQLQHSVYQGRVWLGRYERVAPTRYAAFDARHRKLREFVRPLDAYRAIAGISVGGAQ
jgi:hypothetical protein